MPLQLHETLSSLLGSSSSLVHSAAPMGVNVIGDLPSIQAHALSFLVAGSYVGSIYVSNLFAGQEGSSKLPARQRQRPVEKSNDSNDSNRKIGHTEPLQPISSTDTTEFPGDSGPTPLDTINPSTQSSHINPTSAGQFRPDESDGFEDANRPRWGERDHPVTIKRRIRAVSVATGLSLGTVCLTVLNTSPPFVTRWSGAKGGLNQGSKVIAALKQTRILLGLTLPYLPARWSAKSPEQFLSALSATGITLMPYILAPTLLLGPLYAMYLDRDLPFQGSCPGGLRGRIKRFLDSWTLVEWRNYIVGPITEELTFRSSILALGLLSRQSTRSLIFVTPLWFGIAHAHHALEVYRKGGRTRNAAMRALAGCAFQLTYTTLFGWFASYTYVRTGSVLAATISHIYCNTMGIYLPHIAVQRHPRNQWRVWAAYAAGIAGFVWGLRRL